MLAFKKKKFFKLQIIITVFFAVFYFINFNLTEAKPILRSGEKVSIEDNQETDDDLYISADHINFSGNALADVLMSGTKISFSGNIGEDLLVAGFQINGGGKVNGDLRIAAFEVDLSGQIEGDVFILANTVRIEPTAKINGDLVVYGGKVEVEGEVAGDVVGRIDYLSIDNKVGGNVAVSVNNFILHDGAKISGDVRYTSNKLVIRNSNYNVEGKIIHNSPIVKDTENEVKSVTIAGLVFLFFVLIWYLLFRKSLDTMLDYIKHNWLTTFLTGIVISLLLPILIMLLFLTIIGLPLAIVLLLLYLLVLLLSIMFIPVILGKTMLLLFGRDKKDSKISLFTLLIGVISLMILNLLPKGIITPLLLCLMFINLGVLYLSLFKLIRGEGSV